jgi:hypothetical protein
MSAWIHIVVYATLIVAVWGWLVPWTSRLAIPVIADRNPGWLADHRESERRFLACRWLRWSCLVWGSISLATLLAFQFDAWPHRPALLPAVARWEGLRDLNATFLIVGLTCVAVCVALFFRWLHENVPLSSRREATLERRTLDDYVPRALQYGGFAALVLHLAAWVTMGFAGGHATGAFWGEVAFQCGISGLLLLCLITAIRRPPATLDRIFGAPYRRTEVRGAFAAQLLPLPNGVVRLYELVVGASSRNLEPVMHLGLVVLVVALIAGLAVWSRYPKKPAGAGVPHSNGAGHRARGTQLV